MARQAPILERLDGGDAALNREVAAAPAVSAPPFLLEDYAGLATYRGKPIYNHEQVIGQIDAGVEFTGKTITFTFLDGPHSIGIYNNLLPGQWRQDLRRRLDRRPFRQLDERLAAIRWLRAHRSGP